MDKNFFESLASSIPETEQTNNHSVESLGTAFLTVKVDIDCKLYCDGDFLDLFEANKVKKVQIPRGQHLMTVESESFEDISEDHVIDAADAGNNYLLLVNNLKQRETEIREEQARKEEELLRQKQEQARKVEELLRQKQEQEEKENKGRNLITEVQKNNYQIEIRINRSVRVTRNDIVNLFSTALEGSSYLEASYNTEFYNTLSHAQTNGDTLEDKLADTLLNGGEIYFYDNYAEGELYRESAELVDGNRGMYVLTLIDVIEGLKRAASGTFQTNNDEEFARRCFESYLEDYLEDFDLCNADALMQIILFNEIIYG